MTLGNLLNWKRYPFREEMDHYTLKVKLANEDTYNLVDTAILDHYERTITLLTHSKPQGRTPQTMAPRTWVKD